MPKILDTKSLHRAEPVNASSPSLISDEKLIAIYTAMLKSRMLQQRAAALFQQGKLETDLHASSGRDACAVAVGVDLQPEDTLSIAFGDWLAAFVKGLPAETLFRALAPRLDGNSTHAMTEVQKRNTLLQSNDVDQPGIVRDRAEELHRAKKPLIVAAFFQSPGTLPRHWQKVVSVAAARKLPVLFVHHVVEGSPPVASTLSRSKAPQALSHGVPTIAVDAADPVALYRVAYEAINRARQGRGATMLECAPVPIKSGDPATNQAVQPTDPVYIMESYLKRKGISPEPFNNHVVAEFTRDLDLATRFLIS